MTVPFVLLFCVFGDVGVRGAPAILGWRLSSFSPLLHVTTAVQVVGSALDTGTRRYDEVELGFRFHTGKASTGPGYFRWTRTRRRWRKCRKCMEQFSIRCAFLPILRRIRGFTTVSALRQSPACRFLQGYSPLITFLYRGFTLADFLLRVKRAVPGGTVLLCGFIDWQSGGGNASAGSSRRRHSAG